MNTIFTAEKLKNLFGFQMLIIALFCAAAANAAQAQTLTFTNPAAITINDNAAATPYPSNITVAGFGGNATKVTVTLANINHTFPDDIDILLVSPTGRKFVMLSDVSGTNDFVNTTITLDDAAATALSDSGANPSGTYRPTNFNLNGGGDTFLRPRPQSPPITPRLRERRRLPVNLTARIRTERGACMSLTT